MIVKKYINFKFIFILTMLIDGILCSLPNDDQQIIYYSKSQKPRSGYDFIIKQISADIDKMPKVMSFAKKVVGNVSSQAFSIYHDLKKKKLDQSAFGYDSIIRKSPDDIDKIPEAMLFAKEVAGDVTNKAVNNYNKIKFFLRSPETKEFFAKSYNNIKDLSVCTFGLFTTLAHSTFDFIKVKIDERHQAIKKSEDEKRIKKLNEIRNSRQEQFLRSNGFEKVDDKFIEAPTQQDQTINANAAIDTKSLLPFTLPVYMYNKDFIYKSIGIGVLVVGLSALAYKFRHKAKLGFLKIQKFLLDKRNAKQEIDCSDDLGCFEN